MLSNHRPAIDAQYTNPRGERFTVIGTGTRGIVIEYQDGRVELVDTPNWRSLSAQRTFEQQH